MAMLTTSTRHFEPILMKGPMDLFLWFCRIVLKVSIRLRSTKEAPQ